MHGTNPRRASALAITLGLVLSPMAAAANPIVHPAAHAHLVVKSLQHPCHKKYLVGTFVVSQLKRGAFQVDASSNGTILLHNAKATKPTETLRKVKLRYQFPTGEPQPSGAFTVYAEQNGKPGAATQLTVSACS